MPKRSVCGQKACGVKFAMIPIGLIKDYGSPPTQRLTFTVLSLTNCYGSMKNGGIGLALAFLVSHNRLKQIMRPTWQA